MTTRELIAHLHALSTCEEEGRFWVANPPLLIAQLTDRTAVTAWLQLSKLSKQERPEHFLPEVFTQLLSLHSRWTRLRVNTSKVVDANIEDLLYTYSQACNRASVHIGELRVKHGMHAAELVTKLRSQIEHTINQLRSCGISEDYMLRPTKINDRNAFRTFCVRALTHYLIEHSGRTNQSAVAELISIVANVSDGSLTPDLVGKLTCDLR